MCKLTTGVLCFSLSRGEMAFLKRQYVCSVYCVWNSGIHLAQLGLWDILHRMEGSYVPFWEEVSA